MYNCIFSAHCTEAFCDQSCPILVETSYLLERNGIDMSSYVFSASPTDLSTANTIVSDLTGKTGYYKCANSSKFADMITYAAICKNWKGSKLHCTVYNLRFSKYLELMKQSWAGGTDETLEYMRIWAESAKVLIISNFDYVGFGDFESQTLLNLIQNRINNNATTIIVGGVEGVITKPYNTNPFAGILKQRLTAFTYRPNRGGAQ